MITRNPHDLPKKGKLISFDVGKKTVGIATSDGLRMAATPQKTLQRTKWSKDKEVLKTFIQQENIVAAVVGLPLTMTGDISDQTKSCMSFAENIKNDIGIPVLLWDERLSTQAATNAMFEQRTGRQTRGSKKDVKQQVDSVAASLILQTVLNALR